MPFCDINPKDFTSYSVDTCSAMAIAALIAGKRKPKYPSADEWAMLMLCVNTKVYYSPPKENARTRVYSTEGGNPDLEKQILHVLSYFWILPSNI